MHQVDPLGLMLTQWVRESRVRRVRGFEWYAGDIAQATPQLDTFSTGSFFPESQNPLLSCKSQVTQLNG